MRQIEAVSTRRPLFLGDAPGEDHLRKEDLSRSRWDLASK